MNFDEREAQKAGAGSLAQPPSATSLGRALRQRRKEIGKTMKEVAQEAGLSEGFISQIERGLSTPSLISLYNVANTLGISIEAFLPQNPQPAHSMVSRASERQGCSIDAEERVYQILQRGFPDARLNSCITHMPPGYVSELTRHEGEDFLYLIEGEMLYEVGDRDYLLKAGDTLHFPSSLPHRARNVGTVEARELWVGTTRIIPER
ncbi:helix-turn-helix domain-containing protein [Shinella sp.]|uniref:helix-turn-helix domain-containing protein n=1 Tax=Shinella sp. TaxID=1870904 RepID=UPI003D2E2776